MFWQEKTLEVFQPLFRKPSEYFTVAKTVAKKTIIPAETFFADIPLKECLWEVIPLYLNLSSYLLNFFSDQLAEGCLKDFYMSKSNTNSVKNLSDQSMKHFL